MDSDRKAFEAAYRKIHGGLLVRSGDGYYAPSAQTEWKLWQDTIEHARTPAPADAEQTRTAQVQTPTSGPDTAGVAPQAVHHFPADTERLVAESERLGKLKRDLAGLCETGCQGRCKLCPQDFVDQQTRHVRALTDYIRRSAAHGSQQYPPVPEEVAEELRLKAGWRSGSATDPKQSKTEG